MVPGNVLDHKGRSGPRGSVRAGRRLALATSGGVPLGPRTSASLTTIQCYCEHFDTHSDGEVAFALAHGLLVRLPLVGSAGLWHIGGLLPPQTLTKLIHLRGHVLPGTADTEGLQVGIQTHMENSGIDLIPVQELKETLRISHFW